MATTTTTTTRMFSVTTTLLLLLLSSLPSNAQLPPASSPVNTLTVPSPSDTTTTGATAPSPGGLDCMTALLNMSDCLSYVVTGSKLTKPDKPCCPELAGLVDSAPSCLCTLVGNPAASGFDIDVKKALKLPQVCKVTTPPISLCSVIGVPVAGVPSSAPTAGSSSTEPPSPSLSPQALASSPASMTKDGSSGVKSAQASLLCLLTVLLSIPFFF